MAKVNERKSILIVVQNFSVPKDTRVWLESLTLSQQGYKVAVICPRDKGESRYEKISEIEIFRYLILKPFGGVIGYVFEYLWSIILITTRVIRLHAQRKFDAIQVCNPPDMFFHIGWLCRLTKTKFVFDQHDLCPELLLSKYPKNSWLLYQASLFMEKMSFSVADAAICTNATYARLAMERHNVSMDKLWIVRNGPVIEDFDRVKHDNRLKLDREYLVVYAGEIAEQDGVDILIRMVEEVVYSHNRKDIRFVVLGDGAAMDSVRKLADELKVSSWVEFRGWVQMDELIKYVRSADVCVAPEPSNPLNDKSTFVKVVEYIAAGKPVAAFALPETIVSAGDAAIYAKPNDFVELSAKLVELLDNEEQRLHMQNEAILRRQFLSWEASERVFLDLYDYITAPCSKLQLDPKLRGWGLMQQKLLEINEYK